MPRCNSSWVRKGETITKVTVAKPPKKQTVVLIVAFYPRYPELPVLPSLTFGKGDLVKGAEWTTPANYRAVFTLTTTGNDAVGTELWIADAKPACPDGDHCQGACKPDGAAGVAGSWTLTTWGDRP